MSTLTTDPTTLTRAEARTITAADWGLFILRFALGIIFLAHGGQKMFGWFGGQGLAATVSGFGQMGIPAPLAYLAAFTEFFGGLAVLIGLLSRLASLGLAVTMIVAMAKVHWQNGFFLSDKGIEYNVALLAMALAIALAGPGRLAIADLEARFLSRSRH